MATIAHRSTSSSATLAMTWGVLLVVAVVPLLVDLSNLDDTYYGLKARTLLGLAAVAALGLVGQHEIRSALLRDAGPVLAFGAAAAVATVLSIDPRLALWGSSWRHEGLLVFLAYLVVCVASSELVRRRLRLWAGAEPVVGHAVDAGTHGLCVGNLPIAALTVGQTYRLEVLTGADGEFPCMGKVLYLSDRGVSFRIDEPLPVE